MINEEFVAVVDKLLENKCSSKKQHNQTLTKCNFLQNEYNYSYRHAYICMYTQNVITRIIVCIHKHMVYTYNTCFFHLKCSN